MLSIYSNVFLQLVVLEISCQITTPLCFSPLVKISAGLFIAVFDEEECTEY